MITHFRVNEFRTLLKTFNQDTSGKKLQLKERVLRLLMLEAKFLNHQAYRVKIAELYNSMSNAQSYRPHFKQYHEPQPYPQQSINTSQTGNTASRV